jgi:hypothetical protein
LIAITPGQTGADTTTPMVFWIHILSFACFNALVGYLLLNREQPGRLNLSFYFIAKGAHFLVNDQKLFQNSILITIGNC